MGIDKPAQRAELDRRVEVDVLFAHGVAIGEMSVHIDHPGKHEVSAAINRLIGISARRGAISRPRIGDRVTVDDQGLISLRVAFQSREKTSARDVLRHEMVLPNYAEFVGSAAYRLLVDLD